MADYLFGRIDDPKETERIITTLRSPLYALAAPHLADTGKGKDVFLWKAEESLTGSVRPPHNQTIGDCVSHGWGQAIDTLRFIRLAWQGYGPGSSPTEFESTSSDLPKESFVESATECIYAGARVEIGQGRCGRGDGAVGAWALKFVMDYGVVPRLSYSDGTNTYDLTTYDGKRARSWGFPGHGVPPYLERVSKQYPIKDASLITSYSDLRDAIATAKCPVTVSSNQGFEPFVRDNQGFVRAGGTWGHCMCIVGVSDNPVRPGAVIWQSWGPSQPAGPADVTLPHGPSLHLYPGMFFADADVIDSMLRQHDSFVVSDMIGYPAKELDLSFI